MNFTSMPVGSDQDYVNSQKMMDWLNGGRTGTNANGNPYSVMPTPANLFDKLNAPRYSGGSGSGNANAGVSWANRPPAKLWTDMMRAPTPEPVAPATMPVPAEVPVAVPVARTAPVADAPAPAPYVPPPQPYFPPTPVTPSYVAAPDPNFSSGVLSNMLSDPGQFSNNYTMSVVNEMLRNNMGKIV